LGSQKEWPVYLSLGNIDSTIQSKPSTHRGIHVSLLPIPSKDGIETDGITTFVKEQLSLGRGSPTWFFGLFFRSLNTHFNTGMLMLLADG
jgi:hypothetical protein